MPCERPPELQNCVQTNRAGTLIRDFSFASVSLVFGLLLMGGGLSFGVIEWIHSVRSGHVASSGTVILAALPIILGFQLLLSFLAYDISNQPRIPLLQLLRHPYSAR